MDVLEVLLWVLLLTFGGFVSSSRYVPGRWGWKLDGKISDGCRGVEVGGGVFGTGGMVSVDNPPQPPLDEFVLDESRDVVSTVSASIRSRSYFFHSFSPILKNLRVIFRWGIKSVCFNDVFQIYFFSRLFSFPEEKRRFSIRLLYHSMSVSF